MSSKRLFGTDGVRGVVNVDLTPEVVLRLALAIGTYFRPGSRLVVGSDVRAGNSFLTKIVIGGLISTGVKVVNAG
ncbi:MAG: phosphoglucosamine mutase, partial [Sulfolobales archaeon]